MIHQLFNIDRNCEIILACSGGVDSMAIADFYKRGGKNFELAYFNHGTPQANQMQELVSNWAKSNDIGLHIGNIPTEMNKPKNTSPEEFWRNARYEFLQSAANGRFIVTCHHLNDVAETYLFTAIHGNPKLIAATNGNIVRPFLTTSKQDMIDWCVKHNVSWFEDKSNEDVKFPRNRIRHNILSEVQKVNPGFLKVIKKKIISEFNSTYKLDR